MYVGGAIATILALFSVNFLLNIEKRSLSERTLENSQE